MNNTIKELAVRAGLLIKKRNGDEFRYGYFDPKFQKFAELVWKAAYEEGHDVGVDAGFEAGRNASFTEQHFGVE